MFRFALWRATQDERLKSSCCNNAQKQGSNIYMKRPSKFVFCVLCALLEELSHGGSAGLPAERWTSLFGSVNVRLNAWEELYRQPNSDRP